MVNSAALVAGLTSDPQVSVPKAIGANPALTAIELPEDEPSGLLNLVSIVFVGQETRTHAVAKYRIFHVQSTPNIRRLEVSRGSRPPTSKASAS